MKHKFKVLCTTEVPNYAAQTIVSFRKIYIQALKPILTIIIIYFTIIITRNKRTNNLKTFGTVGKSA